MIGSLVGVLLSDVTWLTLTLPNDRGVGRERQLPEERRLPMSKSSSTRLSQ